MGPPEVLAGAGASEGQTVHGSAIRCPMSCASRLLAVCCSHCVACFTAPDFKCKCFALAAWVWQCTGRPIRLGEARRGEGGGRRTRAGGEWRRPSTLLPAETA